MTVDYQCPNCGANRGEGYSESGGWLEPREGACCRCGFHAIGTLVVDEGRDVNAEAIHEVDDD
jgi:hypothetical protein